MIDLYTWPTPNGIKVHIMVEEAGLDYTVHPIAIGQGEQFQEFFLKLNPNHRIPVMTDRDGPDGEPITIFESGAILIYMANKAGCFLPSSPKQHYATLQWLMFQMGGIGPMFGQANHFRQYATEQVPYAIDRYTNEVNRLYRVLEKRLAEAPYLAGEEYTIADMAAWPWARLYERYGVTLDALPNVRRWHDAVAARPGVQRGLQILQQNVRQGPMSAAEKENMFGKTQFSPR